MLNYLWVAAGSALGGAARYACSGLIARHFGETFPWGTLFVNIAGSFVIGFFATFTGPPPEGRLLVDPGVRQFVMMGFLGGFTTFSSFSLQTLALLRDGEWLAAAANVIASVALCLAAVFAGHALAASYNALRW